jgi:hypothetical protein
MVYGGTDKPVARLGSPCIGHLSRHVHVLRQRRPGVPEDISDLSGGQTLVVESGRTGLPEYMAGHPAELLTASRLT